MLSGTDWLGIDMVLRQTSHLAEPTRVSPIVDQGDRLRPWGQIAMTKIALSVAFILAAGYAAAQTPQQAAAPSMQTVSCADLQRDANAAWWGSLINMTVNGQPMTLAEFLRSQCLGGAPGPFAQARR